jgi:transcriptional regulator with XRE-family HTH domain
VNIAWKTVRDYAPLMAKNRIAEIREAKGLKVKELAAMAGFSAPYVSQMELGIRNISLKNLEKLATALECQPEDLLPISGGTGVDILNIWAAIPPDRRELARQVLESFVTKGVDENALNSATLPAGKGKTRP